MRVNSSTEEKVSVGEVSILLGATSDDHDIFIRRDNVGILSTISYSEVGTEDTGCADDYIRIKKPEGLVLMKTII